MHVNVLLILIFLIGAYSEDTKLEEIIASIFKTSVPPTRLSKRDSYQKCAVDSVCVPKNLCSHEELNVGGVGIIDIRIDDDSGEPTVTECSSTETCCPINNQIASPEIPNKLFIFPMLLIATCQGQTCNADAKDLISSMHRKNESSPFTNVRVAQVNASDMSNIVSWILKEKVTNVPATMPYHVTPGPVKPREIHPPKGENTNYRCGYNTEIDLQEKLNEDDARYGEFPWVVQIFVKLDRNRARCSGALITTKAVLTAAQCVDHGPAFMYDVRAGKWDTQNSNEFYPNQLIQVEQKILHEDYCKVTFAHNIALVFVKKHFDLTPNVNTICLPPDDSFDKSNCYGTGWERELPSQDSNILKKIPLEVISNYDCQAILRKKSHLNESFLCATRRSVSSMCGVHYGSPLVCQSSSDSNRMVLAGVFGKDVECEDRDYPAVFANVTNLSSWVTKTIKKYHTQNVMFRY